MLNITLIYPYVAAEHLSQPLVSFKLLHESRMINLKIIRETTVRFDHAQYIIMLINSSKYVLDFHDGDYTERDHLQEDYDLIFKRSFNSNLPRCELLEKKIKLLPFNYYYTIRQNPYYKIDYDFLIKSICNREVFKSLIKTVMTKLNVSRGAIVHLTYADIERKVERTEFDVLFLTRLWFPYHLYSTEEQIFSVISKDRFLHSTYYCDLERIRIIEYLNNRPDLNCIVGISQTNNLNPSHSKYLIEEKYTNRQAFINTARRSKVCVTTNGLHSSIGWKFGEFVSLTCCILSEKLIFDVPEGFDAFDNFYEYSDLFQFEEMLDYLLQNKSVRDNISINNYDYYQKHLNPTSFALNILKNCGYKFS